MKIAILLVCIGIFVLSSQQADAQDAGGNTIKGLTDLISSLNLDPKKLEELKKKLLAGDLEGVRTDLKNNPKVQKMKGDTLKLINEAVSKGLGLIKKIKEGLA